MRIMVIVAGNGKIIWSHGLAPRDADSLQDFLDGIMLDADLHVFTNYKISCPNPEVMKRLHCFPGASQEEIARQREIFDEKRARWLR